MLDLLLWIVCGGLAGWVACMVVADGHTSTMPGFITVGIMGAILGGLMVRITGVVEPNASDIISAVSAIFGSVLLVAILLLFARTGAIHDK
ncbi:MAG TPA: hypothetical protein VLF43_02985 [Candidatus Saccharimonadales bacterium]|nr:hypothetical protein [Candidatus Saccharimonadales bacterium]